MLSALDARTAAFGWASAVEEGVSYGSCAVRGAPRPGTRTELGKPRCTSIVRPAVRRTYLTTMTFPVGHRASCAMTITDLNVTLGHTRSVASRPTASAKLRIQAPAPADKVP